MNVAKERRELREGRRMADKRCFKIDGWAEVAVVVGLMAHVIVLTMFLAKIQTTAAFAQTTAERVETTAEALTQALGDLETQGALNTQWHEGQNLRDVQQTLVLEELVRIVYSNHPANQ